MAEQGGSNVVIDIVGNVARDLVDNVIFGQVKRPTFPAPAQLPAPKRGKGTGGKVILREPPPPVLSELEANVMDSVRILQDMDNVLNDVSVLNQAPIVVDNVPVSTVVVEDITESEQLKDDVAEVKKKEQQLERKFNDMRKKVRAYRSRMDEATRAAVAARNRQAAALKRANANVAKVVNKTIATEAFVSKLGESMNVVGEQVEAMRTAVAKHENALQVLNDANNVSVPQDHVGDKVELATVREEAARIAEGAKRAIDKVVAENKVVVDKLQKRLNVLYELQLHYQDVSRTRLDKIQVDLATRPVDNSAQLQEQTQAIAANVDKLLAFNVEDYRPPASPAWVKALVNPQAYTEKIAAEVQQYRQDVLSHVSRLHVLALACKDISGDITAKYGDDIATWPLEALTLYHTVQPKWIHLSKLIREQEELVQIIDNAHFQYLAKLKAEEVMNRINADRVAMEGVVTGEALAVVKSASRALEGFVENPVAAEELMGEARIGAGELVLRTLDWLRQSWSQRADIHNHEMPELPPDFDINRNPDAVKDLPEWKQRILGLMSAVTKLRGKPLPDMDREKAYATIAMSVTTLLAGLAFVTAWKARGGKLSSNR